MSRGVEPIFVIKQEIVILLIIEPIVTKGVHVVVRVKYNEPRLN
jgi:hypothetical protein